ncbi:aldehyde dehydrogenase [Halobellus sp. Atlit-38R]|uniref:aldehyde dehydrogenase family protein n=1 Tax=Halobellus sp. Atlit-38R TaxID=2282131 RepID=UPI000EF23BE5|nr:aldehyde dehydrogenase family protein [Halobellus sp. Atlit-38R]RLM83917.1 aldehyde dehydrogenase [Halobellus sp. Atlit-38R]
MKPLYISGEWIEPETTPIRAESPIDESELGKIATGTTDHVDEAINANVKITREFRETNVHERAAAIRTAMDFLEQRADEIAETMSVEVGKPLSEAREEVSSAIHSGRAYAADAIRLSGDTTRSQYDNRHNFTRREPYGPTSIITPWNYPFEIPLDHLSAALVTGNPITWKPASEAALTATHITDAFAQTSLPDGAFNFIPGAGSTIGSALSSHQDVRLIAFTGSTDVGQRIAADAADRSAECLLELGGKDPVLVLDDANIPKAADAIVMGSNYNCGQSCSGTERVIATEAVYEDLVTAVCQRTETLTVGDPRDDETDIGPPINDDIKETMREQITQAVEGGARVITGGSIGDRYIEPTVLADVTPDMRAAAEETFGPLTPIIPVSDREEALKVANDSRYGLQAAVFTESIQHAHQVVDRLQSGGIVVNGTNNFWEHQLPFGGFKESGSGGEYKGHWHLEGMTQLKSVAIDYGE